jgi:hypothetical protein
VCSSDLKDEIGPALNDKLQRAERQQTIAIGSYVVGSVVIATGAALLYMNRRRLLEQGVDEAPPAGRISIAPTLSGDSIGVSVHIRH